MLPKHGRVRAAQAAWARPAAHAVHEPLERARILGGVEDLDRAAAHELVVVVGQIHPDEKFGFLRVAGDHRGEVRPLGTGEEPDVVMAAAGDVPTIEILAAKPFTG